MDKNNSRIKKLWHDEEGVVGIVVAVLLIGLFITILTTIQTIYVPTWMEQKEAEHMENVANQFSMLKFAIDTQIIAEKSMPISTPIELGSKEMPFFLSSKSFGSLEILDDEFALSVNTDADGFLNYSFGTIKYTSKNAYFLDQDYIYEGGAIIMNQSKGSVTVIPPSFSMELDPYENDINLEFIIINISRVKEKTSVSGYGTYPIKTRFSESMSPISVSGVNSITIKTSYVNAWETFFNHTLTESDDLEYGTHFIISKINNGMELDFLTGTDWNKPNLDIKIYNVNAEVGPGWV
ncbi:MAG: hypothetical protein QHH15_02625 [Candidatus Thermoplasmatota archaeon]|jgi:hypothetical protein|nr:hypothetical protein [Candidatus Thermoplasmatota archaeon]